METSLHTLAQCRQLDRAAGMPSLKSASKSSRRAAARRGKGLRSFTRDASAVSTVTNAHEGKDVRRFGRYALTAGSPTADCRSARTKASLRRVVQNGLSCDKAIWRRKCWHPDGQRVQRFTRDAKMSVTSVREGWESERLSELRTLRFHTHRKLN